MPDDGGVRRAWEQAAPWEPAPDESGPASGDYDDFDGEGRETPPDLPSVGLPPDCPVVPLGVHEAMITERRWREAILGVDGGWLADLNSRIAALRAGLVT